MSDTCRQTLERLGFTDYVLRERVILIHAPGTRFPTTMLDTLIVSPIGVFVVTAVQFRGRVTPGPDVETLSVIDGKGEAMVHTSPLRGQVAAARCLRSLLLPHACPVISLAIAATGPCVLHPLLPKSILEADELYHYLRRHTIRFFSSRQQHVSVARVSDAIESRFDCRPEAFAEHQARMIALRPR